MRGIRRGRLSQRRPSMPGRWSRPALTRTTDQKRSIARSDCPWRRSHGPIVSLPPTGVSSAARRLRALTIRHRSARLRVTQPEQRRSQVERYGQPACGRKIVPGSVRGNEMQAAMACEALGDAGPAAEIGQIHAAAHPDMLAVIDPRSGMRLQKRPRPASQPPSAFEDLHTDPMFGGRRAGRQAGQTAADDGDARGGRFEQFEVFSFQFSGSSGFRCEVVILSGAKDLRCP